MDPAELFPGMTVSVVQKFRKGAIVSHPDKHLNAPSWVLTEIERVMVSMIQGRDGMILWLEHLRTGRTHAPRKHQGVYFLELPPDFQWFVLCEVRAVMDIFAPAVPIKIGRASCRERV